MDNAAIIVSLAVVALVLIVAVSASRRPMGPTTPARALGLSAAADIDALLHGRQKIEAIKRLRDETGLGLAAAKQLVDRWQHGGREEALQPTAVATAPATAVAAALAGPGAVLGTQAIQEIDALVASGRRVEAVKRHRELTGLGLRESKQRIDRWVPGVGA